MSVDRYIKWDRLSVWGHPTFDRVAQVLQDFLGTSWKVRATDSTWLVAECNDPMTFPLASEYSEDNSYRQALEKDYAEKTRGFEVYFPKSINEQTSIITRQADEFTSALADRFARIIARWWGGVVIWPT